MIGRQGRQAVAFNCGRVPQVKARRVLIGPSILSADFLRLGEQLLKERPRDPSVPIFSRRTGPRWVLYGLVLAAASLVPLAWGPDEPTIDGPSVSMTMAFAVMGISTAISGLVMRHDRSFAITQPLLRFAGILSIGAVLIVLATELDVLQRWLKTVPLTAPQWGVVLALALVMPLLVEADKAIQRLRAR